MIEMDEWHAHINRVLLKYQDHLRDFIGSDTAALAALDVAIQEATNNQSADWADQPDQSLFDALGCVMFQNGLARAIQSVRADEGHRGLMEGEKP